MKHGKEADRSSEMTRVGGNGEQRFGNGPEQDVKDHASIPKGQSQQLLRQGEHHV
jgi:hypothetical protein